MTKFIPLLAAVFGLTAIAQAADPTPSSSPKPKAKTAKTTKITHHHKTPKGERTQKQMTGS